MVTPLLLLDARELWWPVEVEASLEAVLGAVPDFTTLERLNLPKRMTQPALPVVGYHRCAPGGGLYWHQFWTWWLYNPKNYPRDSGIGEHEGDWEMTQFGCADEAGERPVVANYSQHGGSERRFYWDVELSEGKTGQPLVYVARDSHANYFAPTRTVTDQADGKGEALDPEWREFGAWAEEDFRWGNSANSPGPLPPRRAWRAPHAYTSQARG